MSAVKNLAPPVCSAREIDLLPSSVLVVLQSRHVCRVEPFLELGPSPFLSGRLPKSNARSAPVLVNELNACDF